MLEIYKNNIFFFKGGFTAVLRTPKKRAKKVSKI